MRFVRENGDENEKRNRIRGGHDFTGRVRKTVSVRLLFCSSCLRFGVYYTRLTLKHDNPQLQYAPMTRGQRLPSSLISKGFTFSHGKINLEVTLDREIYYHGEKVIATVVVSNSSRKSVKNIKVMQRTTVVRDGHVAFTSVTANNGYRSIFQVYVVQHTEITMVNAQFSKFVASLETREGCPITPGAAFTKQFFLIPLASSNKDRRGIALDGRLKVGISQVLYNFFSRPRWTDKYRGVRV